MSTRSIAETEESHARPESDGPFPRHHEVFIMGTYLFRPHNIMEKLCVFDAAKVYRVVLRMKRMLEGLVHRLVDQELVLRLQSGPALKIETSFHGTLSLLSNILF